MVLPSQNKLGANQQGRSGWAYKSWRDKAYRGLYSVEPFPVATTYRRVWITRLYGFKCRRYDQHNLHGGAKPLVDCLVKTGALANDTIEMVDIYMDQEKATNGINQVRIVIEEIEHVQPN